MNPRQKGKLLVGVVLGVILASILINPVTWVLAATGYIGGSGTNTASGVWWFVQAATLSNQPTIWSQTLARVESARTNAIGTNVVAETGTNIIDTGSATVAAGSNLGAQKWSNSADAAAAQELSTYKQMTAAVQVVQVALQGTNATLVAAIESARTNAIATNVVAGATNIVDTLQDTLSAGTSYSGGVYDVSLITTQVDMYPSLSFVGNVGSATATGSVGYLWAVYEDPLGVNPSQFLGALSFEALNSSGTLGRIVLSVGQTNWEYAVLQVEKTKVDVLAPAMLKSQGAEVITNAGYMIIVDGVTNFVVNAGTVSITTGEGSNIIDTASATFAAGSNAGGQSVTNFGTISLAGPLSLTVTNAIVTPGGFSAGAAAETVLGAAIGNIVTSRYGAAIGRIAYTMDGGAIGYNAHSVEGGAIGSDSLANQGGAIGYSSSTENGGAVGYLSSSFQGGSVGSLAWTYNGFAGGFMAQCTTNEAISGVIDAIQLGTGVNTIEHSTQFYTNMAFNPMGFILPDRVPTNYATASDGQIIAIDKTNGRLYAKDDATGGGGGSVNVFSNGTEQVSATTNLNFIAGTYISSINVTQNGTRADITVNAAEQSGVGITNGSSGVTLSGTFSGDGSGLTNVVQSLQSYLEVYLSTNVTLVKNVWTLLKCNTEVRDGGNIHNPTTGIVTINSNCVYVINSKWSGQTGYTLQPLTQMVVSNITTASLLDYDFTTQTYSKNNTHVTVYLTNTTQLAVWIYSQTNDTVAVGFHNTRITLQPAGTN